MTVVIQRAYFKATHGKRIFRMTPIHHAFELRGWKEDALDDADSATVGGWTLERFGTFPKPGDSFRYENLTVTVLAMDGRRVERVLVQPDPVSDKDE